MSKYSMILCTDDSTIRGWKDLKFKGKKFDEERYGRWTIEAMYQYELACGTTVYEPVYRCSCCGLITESYLRFDKPTMPDDADFPKWCGNCGARMEEE